MSLCPLISPGHAATYQWVDEQGNIHFSDDLSRVPPSSRQQVVEVPLPVSGRSTAPDEDGAAAGPGQGPSGVGSSGEAVDAYGDCMERLDEKKLQLERQLATDKERLENLITGIRRTTLARKKRQYRQERDQVEERIRQTEEALKTEVPRGAKECASLGKP